MPITSREWQTENSYRSYPFVVAPVAGDGTAFPDAAVADVIICVGAGTVPVLTEVRDGALVFADAVTGTELGTAVLASFSSADIVSAAGGIGTCVFGDCVGVSSGSYSHGDLVPSCVVVDAGAGVVALALPDGTLVTGPNRYGSPVIQGWLGVDVSGSSGSIRVDVKGGAVGVDGAVLGFDVETRPGSLIQAGVVGGGINLVWLGGSLESACASAGARAGAGAVAGDACDDDAEAWQARELYPDGATDLTLTAATTADGSFTITADGAGSGRSPVMVRTQPRTLAQGVPGAVESEAEADAVAAAVTANPGGSIILGLRGVGSGGQL